MSTKTIVSLIIAILSCIGTWLAVPQFQKAITNTEKQEITPQPIQRDRGIKVLEFGRFEGQLAGDNISNGTLNYKSGDVYTGKFDRNEQKSGEGVCLYADGRKYSGTWQNDKFNGQGELTWPNGNRLKGIFRNNHIIIGELTYSNGNRYVGQFNDDEDFHGKGAFYYHSGEEWSGSFRNGHPVEGKYVSVTGDIYNGRFDRKWRYHGKGIIKYSNGNIYEGYFHRNMYEGKGSLYFKDGGKIVGKWKEGVPVKGIYFYKSGDEYHGQFDAKSRRDGQGKMLYANGNVYIGNWLRDRIHGAGTFYLAIGDSLKANFANGNPVNGTYFFASGNKYTGEFNTNWEPDGTGVMYYSDGGKYEGKWAKGYRNGIGKCVSANGDSFTYCYFYGFNIVYIFLCFFAIFFISSLLYRYGPDLLKKIKLKKFKIMP